MEVLKAAAKSDVEGEAAENGGPNMSPGRRREAPYSKSEAEQPESSLTEVRMPSNTKGKWCIQLLVPVAQALDISLSLRVRCCRSIIPLLCG